MEAVNSPKFVFLGIKVKPGPIERFKLENFALDNTVDLLRNEAEKRANIPSTSLELIHHGKILKDHSTLLDSGVKFGEMVHVVKKKEQPPAATPPTYTDTELLELNISLRTLGCTPSAPGWTRAMQLLNDESAMAEIIEHAPSVADDCMTLSMLNEVELIAALGATVQTMRRGAQTHPDLPNALRHLMRLVHSQSTANTSANAVPVPTSGFAYSLEALSEDEDVEEEESEEGEARNPIITQEQLAAALQAASEVTVSSPSNRGASMAGLLRLLQAASSSPTATTSSTAAASEERSAITPEMFGNAIAEALSQSNTENLSQSNEGTPMEQSASASSSQSPTTRYQDSVYATQLQHMHEMGLMDDAHNVRALFICAGNVNDAINLVFSGAVEDDLL